MSTASEPPELVACRAQVDDLLAADDGAGAETVLRSAMAQWPDRLGLQLKLARALEQQGRNDEARAGIEKLVMGRRELPEWAKQTCAHFGFAITAGVRLDIGNDALAGFKKSVFVSDEYERIEAELLEHVLQPHDVILEVGGGIGFIGTFAKLAKPLVTVVSYEANPSLAPIAARTKELNQVEFDTRTAMLGERAGTADFFVNKEFWASSATHDYGGATVIQVPVVPVAQAMAEHPFNVLVMDIEGGEIELVPLMDLHNIDRFVLETHAQITGAKSVRKLLRRLQSDSGLISVREEHGVHLLVRQT